MDLKHELTKLLEEIGGCELRGSEGSRCFLEPAEYPVAILQGNGGALCSRMKLIDPESGIIREQQVTLATERFQHQPRRVLNCYRAWFKASDSTAAYRDIDVMTPQSLWPHVFLYEESLQSREQFEDVFERFLEPDIVQLHQHCELRDLLDFCGVEKFGRGVEEGLRNSIVLDAHNGSVFTHQKIKDTFLPFSRLGGLPNLPSDLEWPEARGIQPPFIAQIKFSEVKPLDLDNRLPATGLLYFFYEEMPSRHPEYHDGEDYEPAYSVLFCADENAPMSTRESPLKPEAFPEMYREGLVLPEYRLMTFTELTAPLDDDEVWAGESGDMAEQEAIFKFKQCFRDQFMNFEYSYDETRHRLLGQPDVVQGDMRPELPDEHQWELLLQIDTEKPPFMWGDGGRLYFWIPAADLAALRFENVRVIMQGH